jgi:hypothetical protein
MQFAETFRDYLLTEHRPRPLSPAAAGNYVSRLQRVERLTGIDFDRFDTSPHSVEALIRLMRELGSSAKWTEGVQNDCATAMRRFAEFLRKRK